TVATRRLPTASATAATPAAVETSAATTVPLPMSSVVSTSGSRRRPTQITSSSRRARAAAVARPTPLPAPVTTANRSIRNPLLVCETTVSLMARPPNPNRKAETLARATDYVLAHGLSGLSLRPLAAALGTSTRMLLYDFGSKEELVADVLAEARRREAT